MKKLFVSWGTYQKMTVALSKKLKKGKFDFIFGIPRGGLPIAVSLSHILNIPLIVKIPNSKGKKILVVDDISDSGRSFNKYKIYKTAALFVKSRTSHIPDYYVNKTNRWIVFPWETEKSSKYDNI